VGETLATLTDEVQRLRKLRRGPAPGPSSPSPPPPTRCSTGSKTPPVGPSTAAGCGRRPGVGAPIDGPTEEVAARRLVGTPGRRRSRRVRRRGPAGVATADPKSG
jgi:hypothetical protein